MRGFILAAAAFAMIGCAKKAAPVATKGPEAASPQTAQAAAIANAQMQEQVREKQPRYGDSAVYVDGVMVAALKYQELPATLKALPSVTKDEAPRFGIPSYLRALGVDLAKVKAVHLHGSNVSMIPGDILRQYGDKYKFSFTAGDHGKPKAYYAPYVRLNTKVDMIRMVAVYVDKEPPHETENFDVVYPDGRPIDPVPYAPVEQGHGTRVYVDGKLVTMVKRKALTNDLLVGDDAAKPRFSLSAFLAKAGVDAKNAKAVDLVSNDALVAHEKGVPSDLTFAVPAHNQGLAQIEIQGKPIKLSAVQLFVKQTPPKREVTPIAELAPAGNDGPGHAPPAATD